MPLDTDKNKEVHLKALKKMNQIEKPPFILQPNKIHPFVIKAKQELNITKSYIDAVARMEWDRQKNILPMHTDQKLQKKEL